MEHIKTKDPAQEWAEKIVDTPMPVLSGTKAKVLKLLSQTTTDFKSLEASIAQDPSFALHIFMRIRVECNGDVEVKTLARAISLIGLEGIGSIALSVNELNKDENQGYLKGLDRSLFAATIVRHWCNKKNHYPADELFWITLFHRAGYWALWILEPEKMQRLILSFSADPQTRLSAEKDIFGCEISEICELLTDYWNTPLVSSLAVEQAAYPDPSIYAEFAAGVSDLEVNPAPRAVETNREINAATTTVVLAHQMVDILQSQWQGKFAADIFGQVAGHLRATLLCSANIVQQAILDHSQNYHTPGLKPSAIYLFNTWPRPAPDPDRPVLSKIAGVDVGPKAIVEKKIKLPQKGLEKDLDQLIDQFENNPDTVQDLQQLFYILGMTLKRELGVKRVAIGLRDPRRASVRISHCFSPADLNGMKGLYFDYLKSPLMAQMIKSQRNIWVKPADKLDMEKLLPPNLVASIHSSNEFFMSSLFSAKRPIGICYLDNGVGGMGLSEKDYLLFKRICRSTRFVFDALASRPKVLG